MLKICGMLTRRRGSSVGSSLRAMAACLQHDPQVRAEFIEFEGGGIAMVGSSAGPTTAAWNENRSRFQVLSGHVVGDRQMHFDAASLPGRLIEDLDRGEQGQFNDIRQMNGVFCLLDYDVAKGRLHLVNDRYGLMPIYYHVSRDEFYFASEAKSILRVMDRVSLDLEGVADFFFVDHMLGTRTLFEQVSAMDSGQVLSWSDGRLQATQYHDFTSIRPAGNSDVSTGKLASLFRQAVAKRASHGRSNTMLLSGGFDSRLILGALAQEQLTPRVVTVENRSATSKGADARCAAEAAKAVGLPCEWRTADPAYLSSRSSIESFYILDGLIPTWSVFIGALYQHLGEDLGVVWDGLGLDVALGASHADGRNLQDNLKNFTGDWKINRLLLKIILARGAFRRMDGSFRRRLDEEVAKVPDTENRFLNFLFKHRTRRRIAVNPYQLFASRIEPVTPAADNDFLDYVLSIPSAIKRKHRLYADLMRAEFPELTRVPVISGGSPFNFEQPAGDGRSASRVGRAAVLKRRAARALEAMALIGRRNAALSQKDQEVRKLLIPLLRIRYFDRPIYNRTLLRRLFALYVSGYNGYHQLFLKVLYLELWHLLFIDKESPLYFDPSAAAHVDGDEGEAAVPPVLEDAAAN